MTTDTFYNGPSRLITSSLIQIAYKAGEMVTSATPAAAGHGTKKNSADLVTETDQAVEKMVSTELKAKFPDFECVQVRVPFKHEGLEN